MVIESSKALMTLSEDGVDLDQLDWSLKMYFNGRRHLEKIEVDKDVADGANWRLKERMKTVSVALVMCLNLGVDPPDVVKTQPCAKLECWIDSTVTVPPKITEVIGANLQKQYERWQPRARYKQSLDPTVDEVKKLCTSLRRNAKEERVLFHYNGHGVPKPTVNGEIWVFNKTFTQYIPLSIYDLQTWMGAPSIYVYDCSNAGIIVDHFKHFAKQHEHEFEQMSAQGKSQVLEQNNGVQPCFRNCLQLAACSTNEVLPMNPELPADLFTACLTTPIKIALQWFVMHNTSKLVPNMTLEMIDKLPGQLNDRRTLMGELNWIFTAITDTIAWNSLPRDVFQRLFRQDLLVASLFRNFLLAERIMRSYNCCPVSNPKLSAMYQHPMWQAWDLAVDLCVAQIPGILERGEPFQCIPFFAEQLTAFQVWLAYGSESRSPPEQLPVVLQVLLSQVHRLRALELLGRFLDLGSWAVHLSLSVGIFPYVLKLLQSSARELSPLLVFIWAKILAVDKSCQVDLVRENGHKYFLCILEDTRMPSEHRMMAAFVLANIVSNYHTGQAAALKGNVIAICLEQLNDKHPHMRQWLAICLGRVWTDFDDARWCGVRDSAHEKLYCLLTDSFPEVRGAAVYALGTFMGCVTERSDHANSINHSIGIKLLNTVYYDGSPLVRKELVVALHYLVLQFDIQLVAIVKQQMEEDRLRETCGSPQGGISNSGVWGPANPDSNFPSSNSGIRHGNPRDKMRLIHSPGLNTSSGSLDSTGSGDGGSRSVRRVSSSSAVSIGIGLPITYPVAVPFTNIFTRIWVSLVQLSTDSHPEVSALASVVVGHIRSKVYTTKEPKEVADTKSMSSFSAPSSPSSRPSFLGSQSPPANMCSSDMQRLTNAAGRSYLGIRTRRVFDKSPGVIMEETGEDCVAKTALISTDFVDWCCIYMARPFMKHLDDMDPESDHFNECEWRYLRNARIRKDAEAEQQRASTTRLDNQVFINRNANMPTCVRFKPYEPHLAVADKDCLSIWDWEQGLRLGFFPNANALSARITAIDFVNGQNHPLLLVGTDDGAAKVWRNYISEDGSEPELATSWQSLTDMLPSNRGAGLVLGWEQESGCLYASGDARIIRVWDCEKELKIKDIPTGADSCVTCMSLDATLAVCGFGDGSIRIYDRRCPSHDCRIATLREHAGWVVNLRLAGSQEHIISGCVTGDVKYWDTRKVSTSVRTFATSQAMTAMAVHPVAEILACGSANQFVTVYTYVGENLSIIKYHDGFMGQRIGPISCLDFHPHKVNLAAGSTDSLISVYAPERRF